MLNKIESILKDVKLKELNKLTIVRIPDPYGTNDTGFVAFYGNRPIPSRGRNEALQKSSSSLTFGECHFLTREGCIENAIWYIGIVRSNEIRSKESK